jgi:oxygen-independent coproporphyrinogen-3 oxidase
MTASLYIHIPFCVSHCDYCDFYSELASPAASSPWGTLSQYTDSLKQELAWALSRYGLEQVPTLYIGGGTPTVLGKDRLEDLLAYLNHVLVAWPAEVTVEANPESVNEDILCMLRSRGVTRLSLGIQSLDEQCRRAVNRSGTVSQCLSSLDLAGRYFPQAFSVDLMSGLPFQTAKGLYEDVQRVIEAGASHVSLYSLTLEAATPLEHHVRSGKIRLPSEEESENIWLAGRNALIEQGLFPYEVSNFAVPGYESKHNMRYWRMESWIGCGPGASTTIIDEAQGTGLRITNRPDLKAYIDCSGEGAPPADRETLDKTTLMKESLMMGFRTIFGPDETRFEQRFHQSIAALIPHSLDVWKGRGMVQENRCALTPEGLLLLNSFLVDCFQELEQQGL